MITNLSELQRHIIKGVDEFDDIIFKRVFMMSIPGIDEKEETKILRQYPGIPKSYASVLRKYNFNGVSIGYFSVSPFSYNPDGMLANLKEANDDPFFPKEFMERHKMYQVGSCNTDLVCVTVGTEQFANGEVLLVEEGIDIYNPKDSQIHLLAKDFEQFLIIAGNFGQVSSEINKDESNNAEKKEEFLDRLKKLKVDEKYHSAWW